MGSWPGVNNRVTSTGIRNLIDGKQFSDYRIIWIWADVANNDREAAFYSIPIIAWAQLSGSSANLVMTTDNIWRSIYYVSDTSWGKRWPGGGIRKIYGW